MKRKASNVCLLFVLAALAATGLEAQSPVEAPEIEWQDHVGRALDGSPIPGRIGRIAVPENRRDPERTNRLEIAFVRFETRHPNPGPPIVFLAGGPGGSGIEGAAIMASHPQIRLLEQRDVIGVDQRGTGLSGPDLTEDVVGVELPFDHAPSRRDLIDAARRAAEETARYWRGRGVDLTAYNSEESADDVDAVRRALGLEQIALWGTSYGSHLGLAYLRRHGASVERAVLTKVEGPDHTFKLPSTVHAHLEHLHRLASGDATARRATPDLLAEVALRLAELERAPVTAEHDGREVVIGAVDLRIALARALGSSTAQADVPAALHRVRRDDFADLAEQAVEHRQVGLHAMALLMDCASGLSEGRRLRLERERADPAFPLGDALLAPFYPEACVAARQPQLGEPFRSALESQVPVLFVSGTLDARTPPGNVEEILPGFSQAVHVVVENAGHESRELMSPEYRDLLQAFLRGERLESTRILLPEPIFADVDTPSLALPAESL